jgi:hypothetical protein
VPGQTQHEPVAVAEAEPKTEAEQETLEEAKPDSAAPAAVKPLTEAQPEQLKVDEAQHEPISTAEAEPKTETEPHRDPEPPEANDIQHEGLPQRLIALTRRYILGSKSRTTLKTPDAKTEGREEL